MSSQASYVGVATDAAPRAAGALPWRRRSGELEVALVHRSRYDDWSWPKGKLDPGEDWPVAAVREVLEETGLRVRLGMPLPGARYALVRPSAGPQTKLVRYWAGQVIGGKGALEHEIDQVRWLPVKEAYDRLTYARDHDQLLALARADRAGLLPTWPLVLVRHAHAVGRSSWDHSDQARPLDRAGEQRARELAGVLGAYRPTRLVSSPSVRCVDTVRPYAARTHRSLRLREGLSEEGYALDPARATRHLHRLMGRGRPAVLCTHGPVLPALVRALADHGAADDVRQALLDVGQMRKGEALVVHLSGTGEDARAVAVERHLS